ncbi:MAG: DUF2934 domain-containing protein [Nitrospiraceae bacterium]
MDSKEISPTTKKKSAPKKISKPQAAATTESRGPVEQGHDLHHLIAARAYELFVRRTTRGPLDDWLEAEREVLSSNGSAAQ